MATQVSGGADESSPGIVPVAEVERLERAALNATPAPRVVWEGGFVLRAFLGGTGRANAVSSLDPRPDPGLEARLDRIEAHYARLGLPCRFRLTPLDPPGLEALLAARGYAEEDGALILRAAVPPAEDPGARWADAPDAAWLSVLSTVEYQGAARRAEKEGAPALLARPATWLVLHEDGAPAACGHAVADDGLCGLFDLAVRPEMRRRGLGRRLLSSLSAWGARQGAGTCWLQVSPENAAARRTYEAAGFAEAYRYRYRVRKG